VAVICRKKWENRGAGRNRRSWGELIREIGKQRYYESANRPLVDRGMSGESFFKNGKMKLLKESSDKP